MLTVENSCTPQSLHANHGAMAADPGALEANPGPVEVYLGSVEPHLRALEAHPGVLEAHSVAMNAHPGAVEAHTHLTSPPIKMVATGNLKNATSGQLMDSMYSSWNMDPVHGENVTYTRIGLATRHHPEGPREGAVEQPLPQEEGT